MCAQDWLILNPRGISKALINLMAHGCTNVAWVGVTSVSITGSENVDIRKYGLQTASFSAESVGRRTIKVRMLGRILQVGEMLGPD